MDDLDGRVWSSRVYRSRFESQFTSPCLSFLVYKLVIIPTSHDIWHYLGSQACALPSSSQWEALLGEGRKEGRRVRIRWSYYCCSLLLQGPPLTTAQVEHNSSNSASDSFNCSSHGPLCQGLTMTFYCGSSGMLQPSFLVGSLYPAHPFVNSSFLQYIFKTPFLPGPVLIIVLKKYW